MCSFFCLQVCQSLRYSPSHAKIPKITSTRAQSNVLNLFSFGPRLTAQKGLLHCASISNALSNSFKLYSCIPSSRGSGSLTEPIFINTIILAGTSNWVYKIFRKLSWAIHMLRWHHQLCAGRRSLQSSLTQDFQDEYCTGRNNVSLDVKNDYHAKPLGRTSLVGSHVSEIKHFWDD